MWVAVACLCAVVCGVVAGENSTRPDLYPATRDPVSERCQPDKLTVYKVILHTFWSRTTFPKHYPDWRPSAQWSKVFGEL
ncbi:hypothetical protein WA026_003806 [Henosepilachna vigintioctopunctata]|uniref:Spondin domain-containing protein n=1 Tax=Henosepilachna vigintioctopunctata TaxID=420089 RepID=A0AAW1U7Y0_9CUCU